MGKSVKHIVLFRLLSYTSSHDKNTKALQIKKAFGPLKNKIPDIKAYQAALNEGSNSSAYDVCINATFESWEALAAYNKHPAHLEAIKLNQHIKKEKAVIDYEL